MVEIHRSQAEYVRNGKGQGWKLGMNKSETVLAKIKEIRLKRVRHRVSKS